MKFLDSEFEFSAWEKENLPHSVFPEIVFSGKSNVGKSSLLNKLLNKKSLARTSSIAGKTIGINFYKVNFSMRFVDLPGYGYAKISYKEKLRISELVENYFKQNRKLALIIQLIDMRHKPSKNDLDMLDFLYKNKLPFIITMSKSDKLKTTSVYNRRLKEIKNELEKYEKIEKISFSSLRGNGILEIKKLIASKI